MSNPSFINKVDTAWTSVLVICSTVKHAFVGARGKLDERNSLLKNSWNWSREKTALFNGLKCNIASKVQEFLEEIETKEWGLKTPVLYSNNLC